MDETLNIILDSEQIIFKKTTRLQRAIQKILNKFNKEEEIIETKPKKKNKHVVEELFGYEYNTIMTEHNDKKIQKAKRKKRRR